MGMCGAGVAVFGESFAHLLEGANRGLLLARLFACVSDLKHRPWSRRLISPGDLVVEKTKHDLHIACEIEGFLASHAVLTFEGATWETILIGGGIGWPVFWTTGADKYEEVATITLVPYISPAAGGTNQGAADRGNDPALPETLGNLNRTEEEGLITGWIVP